MDRRWQWLVASVWNGLNVCALTDELLGGLWEYPSHLVEIGNKNFQLMVKEVEDALITPQHKLRFLQQERDTKRSRKSELSQCLVTFSDFAMKKSRKRRTARRKFTSYI
jgi:hypothetical protein